MVNIDGYYLHLPPCQSKKQPPAGAEMKDKHALLSTPSHQGILSYSLMLVHRYHGYAHGVPVGNLINDNEMLSEYDRLWNMIQQYMDISKPLPDILMLEEARDKDPVTIKYDKQTQRDPEYWRSMSDEEYEIAVLDTIISSGPASGQPIDIFER